MKIAYLSFLIFGSCAFGNNSNPEADPMLLNSSSEKQLPSLTSYKEVTKPTPQPSLPNSEKKEPWFKGFFIYTHPAAALKPGTIRLDTRLLYNESSKFYFDEKCWRFKDLNIGKPRHCQYTINIGAGLFKNVDIYFEQPVDAKYFDDKSAIHLGDAFLEVGFQALNKQMPKSKESLRFFLSQTIPLGKYNNLNPNKGWIDSSGYGLWTTEIGFSSQSVFQSFKDQFTRILWGWSGVFIPTSTKISGWSTYRKQCAWSNDVELASAIYSVSAIEQTLAKRWSIGFGIWRNWRTKYWYKLSGFVPLERIVKGPSVVFAQIQYNFSKNLGLTLGSRFRLEHANMPRKELCFVMTYIFD